MSRIESTTRSSSCSPTWADSSSATPTAAWPWTPCSPACAPP